MYFLLTDTLGHGNIIMTTPNSGSSGLRGSQFLNSNPNLPVAVSTGFGILPICALKSPITIV